MEKRQQTNMNTEFSQIEKRIYKFGNLATTQAFANHARKIRMIVLGDDGKYWAATPVDAAQLEEMGYEIL